MSEDEKTVPMTVDDIEEQGTNWGLIALVILIIAGVLGLVLFLEGSVIGNSRFGGVDLSYSPAVALMRA